MHLAPRIDIAVETSELKERMWKAVWVWIVVALCWQLPEAIAVSDGAEAYQTVEGPKLSASPLAICHSTAETPHAGSEEERPEEECDENDDFHSPSSRSDVTDHQLIWNVIAPWLALDLQSGHASLWPIPPDANN